MTKFEQTVSLFRKYSGQYEMDYLALKLKNPGNTR